MARIGCLERLSSSIDDGDNNTFVFNNDNAFVFENDNNVFVFDNDDNFYGRFTTYIIAFRTAISSYRDISRSSQDLATLAYVIWRMILGQRYLY